MSQSFTKNKLDMLPQKDIVLPKDLDFNKEHTFRVLTCNLRGAFSLDGINAWENCCHSFLKEIRRIDHDLIDYQKMEQDNFKFLILNL